MLFTIISLNLLALILYPFFIKGKKNWKQIILKLLPVVLTNFVISFLVFSFFAYIAYNTSKVIYSVLDLYEKITALTYAIQPTGVHTEAYAFFGILHVLSFLMAIICSMLSVVKFLNNTSVKISDNILSTIKYVIFNWKFWAIFGTICVLLLCFTYKFAYTNPFLTHTNIALWVLVFALIPKSTEEIFVKYLEEKEFSLAQKGAWIAGVLSISTAGLFFIGWVGDKICTPLQNKMPEYVKINREIEYGKGIFKSLTEFSEKNREIENEAERVNEAKYLIKKYPEHYKAYQFLGDYYFNNGNKIEGIKYTKKAIELAPDLIPWKSYSNLLSTNGVNEEQRIALAYKSLEHYPKNPVCEHIFNHFYNKKKDLKGLVRNKEHYSIIEMYTLISIMHNAEHYEKNLELIKYAKKVLQEETSGESVLNFALPKERVFERCAMSIIYKLLGLGVPTHSYTLDYYLVRTYIALNDFELAARYINLIKDEEYSHRAQIELLVAQEKYDEAEKIITEHWENSQSWAESLLKLYLKTDARDFKNYYSKLTNKQKMAGRTPILYAEYLNKQKRYKEAIAILESLENGKSRWFRSYWCDMKVLKNLQYAYEKLGNTQKASEYQKKIDNVQNAF